MVESKAGLALSEEEATTAEAKEPSFFTIASELGVFVIVMGFELMLTTRLDSLMFLLDSELSRSKSLILLSSLFPF